MLLAPDIPCWNHCTDPAPRASPQSRRCSLFKGRWPRSGRTTTHPAGPTGGTGGREFGSVDGLNSTSDPTRSLLRIFEIEVRLRRAPCGGKRRRLRGFTQVFEDPGDRGWFCDEGDELHRMRASGAKEGKRGILLDRYVEEGFLWPSRLVDAGGCGVELRYLECLAHAIAAFGQVACQGRSGSIYPCESNELSRPTSKR